MKDRQRSNEKTMGKGSSGERQRECLPSPSLKVCMDGRWTHAGVITKFPWIDRFSFPIGMFIYHSMPLLYVQSHLIILIHQLLNLICVLFFPSML